MGCSSCGTGGGGCGTGTTGGCSKTGGCATGGCNKLNSFDWLSNMGIGLAQDFDVVEVRFKNGRKEFYRNTQSFELYTGDPVVVEMPSGYHLGHVALQGEIVRLQLKRKMVNNDDQLKTITRKASQKDIEKYILSKNREETTVFRTRHIILEQKLEMKLTDVEFQADNSKATFYYSADERVDFRELIKLLASEFKVRVEMKQISLRHEAARLGGIGSCGRELCCSTWISDFKNVNTSAARYQNLSLNPSKLSGQCGRLKCCLNYELETYLDALKGIPEVEKPLLTERGRASIQKTDIFKKIMWFSYEDEPTNWIAIPVDRVNHIQAMNADGNKPSDLLNDQEKSKITTEFIKEKSELARFDDKFQANKNKRKKKKKKTSDPTGASVVTEGGQPRPQNQNSTKPAGPARSEHQPREGQQSKPRPQNPNREGNPRPPQQNREGQPRPPQQNREGQPRPQNPNQNRPPREGNAQRENVQGQTPRPEGQPRPPQQNRPNQPRPQNPNPNKQQNNGPKPPQQGGQQNRPNNNPNKPTDNTSSPNENEK
ncbi:MAG: Signal peptidase-like protein [Chitinophagaceae bacterium]|nr:Signal peptidase-like protein [Chitinophagaceae bacterium]